ncbi:YkgJ family cysteine cluster protein [Desulfovibrio sp. ZJ369]|uniref:YkgJ family cysteine cluster protein n=1 Tax=Desulfovibrio sp. ZJ369 TaxID=2709793 RepID=UPI0013EB7E11|nr:YkgJ family cysteine cluster protein [Desulfovibrio sp. ZJ369]
MPGRHCEAARFRHRDRALESLLPDARLVLDACALVDLSVAEAVDKARKAGRSPACKTGCPVCCCQPIPVTPLESLVIEAWLQLHVPVPRRMALARQFEASAHQPPQLRPCPFLAENVCRIYPLRPLACRRYLVLDRPCAPGEDPARLRPGDLLRPDPAMLTASLLRTLPWYKEWPSYPRPVTKATASAFFHAVTFVLQALPWQKMLEKNVDPA